MAIITKRRKHYSLVYEQDGKQVYETYPSYKLARNRKIQVENNQFELMIDRDLPFYEYLYLFLNIKGKQIWGIKTLNTNISIVDTYVAPVINQIKISDIHQGFADDLFHQLKQIPPSILIKAKVILLKAADDLVNNGYLESNPFKNIQVQMKTKEKEKHQLKWTMDDTVKLLNECKDMRLVILLHLIYGTNLRINEILALHLDDLFMTDALYLKNECYIRVNKVLERLNVSVIQMLPQDKIIKEFPNHGSTDSPTRLTLYYIDTRFIPLIRELATLLMLYSKDKIDLKHQYLISKSNGDAIDRRVLTRNLTDTLKQLNLPHITMVELKAFSNMKYDDNLTNREYYYTNYCTPEEIIEQLQPQQPNSTEFQQEIRASLPDPNQILANEFIAAINEDEDLKMELIDRLKELL